MNLPCPIGGWRPDRLPIELTQPGYTTTPLANGLAMLTHEETMPDGRTIREETTYRVADGIPMLQVTTVNGVEVDRKEAIEFHLGGS